MRLVINWVYCNPLFRLRIQKLLVRFIKLVKRRLKSNQIGCIYTAQGFEFDYVGVIFGKDLVYNLDKQTWEGYPENSSDKVVRRSKDKFVDLVKNTYRVLLSRGMKGCYVYFVDKDTERFFKSRTEKEKWNQ